MATCPATTSPFWKPPISAVARSTAPVTQRPAGSSAAAARWRITLNVSGISIVRFPRLRSKALRYSTNFTGSIKTIPTVRCSVPLSSRVRTPKPVWTSRLPQRRERKLLISSLLCPNSSTKSESTKSSARISSTPTSGSTGERCLPSRSGTAPWR